jgi:hypothetical protein
MTMPTAIPLAWHKRQAMALAGQLPENMNDARLVLVAMQDLVDNFMGQSSVQEGPRAANVLPFGTAG